MARRSPPARHPAPAQSPTSHSRVSDRGAHRKSAPLTATGVNDLCASFQAAVVDTIINRIRVATRLFRHRIGPFRQTAFLTLDPIF
jgi:hypothetical protein